MLKLATLGAALAAVLTSPIDRNQLTVLPRTEQLKPAIASNLVTTKPALNLSSGGNDNSTAILTADYRFNTRGIEESSNSTALVLGLAIGGVGAIAIAAAARNAKQSLASNSTYPNANLGFRSSSPTGAVRVEQVSRKLRQRLMLLMHEDREAANRLLSRVKLNNPHRSVDWCADKVIYDLKRDRGGY